MVGVDPRSFTLKELWWMACGRLDLQAAQLQASSMSKLTTEQIKKLNYLRWFEPDEDDDGEPLTEEQRREMQNRNFDLMAFGKVL
jgi:hypothetical protein